MLKSWAGRPAAKTSVVQMTSSSSAALQDEYRRLFPEKGEGLEQQKLGMFKSEALDLQWQNR